MGNRLRTEDFLHRCSFTVVSSATSPRPAPVTPAPTTRVLPAQGDTGALSPTGPRRRAGTVPSTGARYGAPDVCPDHGDQGDQGGPGFLDDRDEFRLRGGVRRQVRNPYLAGLVDLVLVLALTVIFSVVFGVVVGRDVFGGGTRQLLVWVVVTVIAWAVCTTARSDRGRGTPRRRVITR